MKLALAIVCSLLLAGTPIVPANASAAPDASQNCKARPCCSNCAKCCAVQPASQTPPAAAAPAPPGAQHLLVTVAPPTLTWALPATETRQFLSFPSFSSTVAPLYARDCARLI